MQIIERFSLGKNGKQEKNEDLLFTGNRFIAVVDGVTSKTAAPCAAEVSSGKFAAQSICDNLETMPNSTDAMEILVYLNEKLKKAISESVFAAQIEPPAASLILYDSWSGRVISYGDCQLLLKGKKYQREKKLDRICARKRAAILEKCIREGQSEKELLACDVGRKAIEPDILDSFLKNANHNTEYGFGVLGTGQIQPGYIDIYPVEPGEEVILASDGYPVLLSTLGESEKALDRIICEDPLLIRKYISTKGVAAGNISYDDRTYVRFISEKSLF